MREADGACPPHPSPLPPRERKIEENTDKKSKHEKESERKQ